jgi:hypothetical protein
VSIVLCDPPPAALEGAIILARVGHDLTPLDELIGEHGPLLDAVAASDLPLTVDQPAGGPGTSEGAGS